MLRSSFCCHLATRGRLGYGHTSRRLGHTSRRLGYGHTSRRLGYGHEEKARGRLGYRHMEKTRIRAHEGKTRIRSLQSAIVISVLGVAVADPVPALARVNLQAQLSAVPAGSWCLPCLGLRRARAPAVCGVDPARNLAPFRRRSAKQLGARAIFIRLKLHVLSRTQGLRGRPRAGPAPDTHARRSAGLWSPRGRGACGVAGDCGGGPRLRFCGVRKAAQN